MESKRAIISLAITVLIGVLTAYFAKNRGKSPLLWFFIGMLFGIFGFIALFFFPVEQETLSETEKLSPRASQELVNQQPPEEPFFQETAWFYADKVHAQQGPVPFDELQRLWNLGEIVQDTYVWTQGMKEWKKIGEELQLQKALQKK